MPTINQTNTIDITPERFLNACSDNEIRELGLLLNSKRFDSSFSGNSDNSDAIPKIPVLNSGDSDNSDFEADIVKLSIPEDLSFHLYIFKRIEIYEEPTFVDLLKYGYTGEFLKQAFLILQTIARTTPIAIDEALLLSRSYIRLEQLRLLSLVKKPQTKTEL